MGIRISRNRFVGAIMLLIGASVAGIWWALSGPAPNPPPVHSPIPDMTSHVPGKLEFSSPLILALDAAETKQTEVLLTNSTASPVQIQSVESNCTCTRVVSFPQKIPARSTGTLVLSSLGAETGQSRITIQSDVGVFSVAVMTHVRGEMPDPNQALQDRIALYKDTKHVWLGVLLDLGGHFENCGCSAHALGGLPSILAAQKDLAAAGIHCVWLASGDSYGSEWPTVGLPLLQSCGVTVLAGENPISPEKTAISVTAPGRQLVLNGGKTVDLNLRDGMGVDWIVVTADGKYVDHWAWLVDARMKPDAEIQAKVAAYFATKDSAAPAAGATKTPVYTESNISLSCKSCHENTYAIWEKSGHAKAIDILKAKHADTRQDCLICHTTPPPAPPVTPTAPRPQVSIANVHCLACHAGPNLAQHMTGPKANPLSKTFSCIQCHTPTANPEFDQVVAWKRIQCLPTVAAK